MKMKNIRRPALAAVLLICLSLTALFGCEEPHECPCGDHITVLGAGEICRGFNTGDYYRLDKCYISTAVLDRTAEEGAYLIIVGYIDYDSLAVAADAPYAYPTVTEAGYGAPILEPILTERLSDADLRPDGRERWLLGGMALVFSIDQATYGLLKEGEGLPIEASLDLGSGVYSFTEAPTEVECFDHNTVK